MDKTAETQVLLVLCNVMYYNINRFLWFFLDGVCIYMDV